MDRRFVSFLMLSFGVLMLSQVLFPPPPPVRPLQPPAAEEATDAADRQAENEAAAERPLAIAPRVPADAAQATEPELEFVTLGSIEPASGYRMLVTLTNRGAAVRRAELSSPRYRDLHWRGGYLGEVSLPDTHGPAEPGIQAGGVLVQVVGAGTPAEQAGLKPGDRILSITGDSKVVVNSVAQLERALEEISPGRSVAMDVERASGEHDTVQITLGRRPLEVLRPEVENMRLRNADVPADFVDPPSFLTSLAQVDGHRWQDEAPDAIDRQLRESNWEVVQRDDSTVTMRRALAELQLEIVKRYTLQRVPDGDQANADFPGYDLQLDVEIRNLGDGARQVAYVQSGPTGLPIEGWWYASRISHGWSAAGLRDVVVRFADAKAEQFRATAIAEDDVDPMGQGASLAYASVDAQYFAAAMIPQKQLLGDVWFETTEAVRIGPEPDKRTPKTYTNVSFDMERRPVTIEPGAAHRDSFQIFIGPKRPELLKAYFAADNPHYNLSDLIYYGWFGSIAKGMVSVLHVFYGIVGNYGIAIIMLTLVVRGCMFPLTWKQTKSMARMQALKPEMDRITEKYRTDMQKRQQAMQELYAKHNVNPLAGCLPLFIQLPIFMGLYRGLMIDVELRQSPLFSETIRWCSNLAAPDMFYDWSWLMPRGISSGIGIFGLGPYLNLFPLITVVLFMVSQKMFMPEPTNEQMALQQKMMKYMTLFMGLIFYKVAAGLCLYFIISSLWGIVERKLLPKPAAAGESSASSDRTTGGSAGTAGRLPSSDGSPPRNGSPKKGKGKKRQKAKRKK